MLITDHAVVAYRAGQHGRDNQTVEEAAAGGLVLEAARVVRPGEPVDYKTWAGATGPAVVADADDGEIRGILTAFDLL